MSKLVEMALDLVLKEIPPEVRAMLSQENVERMGVKLGELYQKLDKHIDDMTISATNAEMNFQAILAAIEELKQNDNGSRDGKPPAGRARGVRAIATD